MINDVRVDNGRGKENQENPPRTLFIGAVSSVVEALDFFALEAED